MAQLGDALLTTQAFQHNADLFLRFVQLTLTPNSGAAGDDVLRAVAELHNHYAVTVAECPKLDFFAATDLDCIWSKSALEISR